MSNNKQFHTKQYFKSTSNNIWIKILNEYLEWCISQGKQLCFDKDSRTVSIVTNSISYDMYVGDGEYRMKTSCINYRIKKLEKSDLVKVTTTQHYTTCEFIPFRISAIEDLIKICGEE